MATSAQCVRATSVFEVRRRFPNGRQLPRPLGHADRWSGASVCAHHTMRPNRAPGKGRATRADGSSLSQLQNNREPNRRGAGAWKGLAEKAAGCDRRERSGVIMRERTFVTDEPKETSSRIVRSAEVDSAVAELLLANARSLACAAGIGAGNETCRRGHRHQNGPSPLRSRRSYPDPTGPRGTAGAAERDLRRVSAD